MIALAAIGGIILLSLAFGVYTLQPLSTTGSFCLQSAVQPYAFASICAPSQSYVDSILYTTSSSSTGGIWSGLSTNPSQLTTPGGFLKVYYFLASGAVLSTYGITYNKGLGDIALPGVIKGTEATSMTWFGAPVPNAALTLNSVTSFRATMKDNVGTSSSITGYFRYTSAGYVVKFQVFDGTGSVATGSTPALAGVQIILKVAGTGSAAGQVITDSLGSASISLPYGTYIAAPTAPLGYFPAPVQSFSSWLAPTLKWTLSKPAIITSVTLPTNTFTGCGQYDTTTNSCSMTLTYENTFTGTDGSTTTSGYTGTCYAVAGCTMTSSTTVISGGTTSVTTTTESGTGGGGGSGGENGLANTAVTYTLGAMGAILLIASIFISPGKKGGRK